MRGACTQWVEYGVAGNPGASTRGWTRRGGSSGSCARFRCCRGVGELGSDDELSRSAWIDSKRTRASVASEWRSGLGVPSGGLDCVTGGLLLERARGELTAGRVPRGMRERRACARARNAAASRTRHKCCSIWK